MPLAWDPALYLRYGSERERPFWDLVAQIPSVSPERVVDLGCGPGTATAGLLDRWPGASVLGVDNSAAMIERARGLEDPPRLTFELDDVRSWETDPGSLDVIVSNATLQWVPSHLELLPRLLGFLRPRGVLAFQVPGNFDAPSHTILAALAASPRWRDRLARAAAVRGVPSPAEYHRRLRDLGAEVEIWETIYHHRLSGSDPVLEWVRATALRPYLAELEPAEAEAFTASYAEALRAAYPPAADGETLFAFRRLFVVATLP